MNQLYKYVGITRQAIDQYSRRQEAFDSKVLCLLSEVEELRKEHPGCGVEKMYFSLNPDFIGRDRFIELFMDLGFRLKKGINYKRTTYSVASKYKNLIKGLVVSVYIPLIRSRFTFSDRKYFVRLRF